MPLVSVVIGLCCVASDVSKGAFACHATKGFSVRVSMAWGIGSSAQPVVLAVLSSGLAGLFRVLHVGASVCNWRRRLMPRYTMAARNRPHIPARDAMVNVLLDCDEEESKPCWLPDVFGSVGGAGGFVGGGSEAAVCVVGSPTGSVGREGEDNTTFFVITSGAVTMDSTVMPPPRKELSAIGLLNALARLVVTLRPAFASSTVMSTVMMTLAATTPTTMWSTDTPVVSANFDLITSILVMS